MGTAEFRTDSYLGLLAARTKTGLGLLDSNSLSRHAVTILSFQDESGGFRGRRGGADIYYTGFAVRALHALDGLQGTSAPILSYLTGAKCEGIIDELNRLSALMLLNGTPSDSHKVCELIERFRTPDGGYGKRIGDQSGSTYHTFLAVVCRDLVGCELRGSEKLKRFVALRIRDDGGFSEHHAATHSNTNATAAGLLLLELLNMADRALLENATEYLLSAQDDSGGWLSTRRAPVPDLLSTYTALVSLENVGTLPQRTLGKGLSFALACERREGGFSAGTWDTDVDVEYTYYGLGTLALAGLCGMAGTTGARPED